MNPTNYINYDAGTRVRRWWPTLWRNTCILEKCVHLSWPLCLISVLQAMADIVKKHLHSGEVCSPQLTAVFDICVAGDGRHCEETPAFWWSVFTSVGPALPYVRQCHLWDGQGVFRFPAVPAGGTPLQVVVSVLKCLSQRPSDAYLWLRDLDLTCAERWSLRELVLCAIHVEIWYHSSMVLPPSEQESKCFASESKVTSVYNFFVVVAILQDFFN